MAGSAQLTRKIRTLGLIEQTARSSSSVIASLSKTPLDIEIVGR